MDSADLARIEAGITQLGHIAAGFKVEASPFARLALLQSIETVAVALASIAKRVRSEVAKELNPAPARVPSPPARAAAAARLATDRPSA